MSYIYIIVKIMDKETYIKSMKENNPLIVAYFYYKEKGELKYNLLSYNSFCLYFQMWPYAQDAFNVSCIYYENKLNIIKIIHSNNRVTYL